MKLYLSGPMRGYPLFNFPAFDAGAAVLREAGYEVFNPAERDRAVYGPDIMYPENADRLGFDLRAALGADVAWIAEHADGVAMLDGWLESRGARAEVALGDALRLPTWSVATWLEEGQLSVSDELMAEAVQ